MSIKKKVLNSKIPISVCSAVCVFPFSSADVYTIRVCNQELLQAKVVLSQFVPKQTSLMN